ncbi:Hypothetical protein CM240_2667 [Clostridium bornimense]|uniref:DUF1858 domain-containing protein n=1 Tax=Clostridium bornimense TaxID=1216932 RepID=W6S1M5_9CLOT|nr:DUF1858 domain-containing protein [Clostridium bornimense]CDM69784.1 Hypothetical protein CM240_2667 [Clostridium bornimense]
MINKDMTIGEIIRLKPEAAEVLMNFGFGCVGCPASQMETLEQGAQVHGVDVEVLVEALNK